LETFLRNPDNVIREFNFALNKVSFYEENLDQYVYDAALTELEELIHNKGVNQGSQSIVDQYMFILRLIQFARLVFSEEELIYIDKQARYESGDSAFISGNKG